MLKRKSIFSYNVYDTMIKHMNPEDYNLWFEKCSPNTSKWYKNLPPFHQLLNTIDIKDLFNEIRTTNTVVHNLSTKIHRRTTPTMKTCPGITDLFKHSILLKAPLDMTIHFKDKDGEHSQVILETSDPGLISIETHQRNQFSTGGRWSKYRNAKFCFPFLISSTQQYLFTSPFWHNETPFIVPPGGVYHPHSKHTQLNLNVFFEMDDSKEINTFNIKGGQAMAYIIFPHPPEIKYDPSVKQLTSIAWLKEKFVKK